MSFLKGIFGAQGSGTSSSSSSSSSTSQNNQYPGQATRQNGQIQPIATVAYPPGYQDRPSTPHRSSTSTSTPQPTRAAPPAKQHPSHLISANQAAGIAATARHSQSTSNGVTNRAASSSTTARPPHVPFSHASAAAAGTIATPPPPYQPRTSSMSSTTSNHEDDMFGGMSVKTTIPSSQQPQQQQQQQAPPTSGGFDMDDMFSGLTLSGPATSTTPTPQQQQQQQQQHESSQEEQQPSLLNMISHDESDASEPGDDTQPSGFGFISENHDDINETPSTTSSTSAFNFMPQQDRTISLDDVPGESGLDLDGLTIKADTPVKPTSTTAPTVTAPVTIAPVTSTSTSPPIKPTPKMETPPKMDAETIESVTSRLNTAIAHYWSTLERINIEQSHVRQQEINVGTTLREAHEKLKECEREQARAIADEEYEHAEILNQEIEKWKHTVMKSTSDLANLQNKLVQDENAKESATKEMLAVVATSNAALIRLKSKQVSEMTSFVNERTSILEKEEDQLNADMDRVERALTHTKQDIELVQKEQDQVDAAIESDTKDLATEKTNLELEQEKLQHELEELLRQVRAKEEEIAMNAQKREVAQTKIASVRASHEKKLKRIAEKRERYVAEKTRAESEASALTQRRTELENDNRAIRERELVYKAVIKNISEEINSAHLIGARLEFESKRRAEWKDIHQRDHQCIHDLQQQLTTITSQLDTYRASLLNLETSANTHHKTIASVNQKIPTLEADKKLAVTARDFKNAAKYSADIKNLQTNKQEAENALEELKIQVADTQSRITSASESKTEIQSKIIEAQDMSDLHRYHMLVKNERSLKTLLSRAETALTSAIDSGASSPALASEVSSLRTELTVVTTEMTDLRTHHTWTEQQLYVQYDDDLITTLDAPGPEPTEVPDHKKGRQRTGSFVKEEEKEEKQEEKNDVDILDESDESSSKQVSSHVSESTTPAIASPRIEATSEPPSSTWTDADTQTTLQQLSELKQQQTDLENELEKCIEQEEYDRAEALDDRIREVKDRMTELTTTLIKHGIDPSASASASASASTNHDVDSSASASAPTTTNKFDDDVTEEAEIEKEQEKSQPDVEVDADGDASEPLEETADSA